MARESAQLSSSVLSAAGYDADTRTLDITFRSGRTYTFPNVPETIWEGLRDAPSAGQYFNEQIKGVFG